MRSISYCPGRIKVLIPDEQGREVILAVMGPQRIFWRKWGLLDDQPRSAQRRDARGLPDVAFFRSPDFIACLKDKL